MATLSKYGKYFTAMTSDEVTKLGVIHLLIQGKKSMREFEGVRSPLCVYNGGDVCCAAAPFIPEYHEKLERKTWSSLQAKNLVPGGHTFVMIDLQQLHDRFQPNEWARRAGIIFPRHRDYFRVVSSLSPDQIQHIEDDIWDNARKRIMTSAYGSRSNG